MRAGPGIGPADRIGPSNGRDHRTTGCKNSGSRNSFALANDLLPAPAPTPAAAEAAAAANKPHDEQEYRLLVVLICLGAILQRVLPPAGINWLVEVGGAKYKTDWRVFDCIAIGMRFVSSPSRTNYSVRRSSTVQSTKCEDRRRAALHLSASRCAAVPRVAPPPPALDGGATRCAETPSAYDRGFSASVRCWEINCGSGRDRNYVINIAQTCLRLGS
jgi:hypothetical protein